MDFFKTFSEISCNHFSFLFIVFKKDIMKSFTLLFIISLSIVNTIANHSCPPTKAYFLNYAASSTPLLELRHQITLDKINMAYHHRNPDLNYGIFAQFKNTNDFGFGLKFYVRDTRFYNRKSIPKLIAFSPSLFVIENQVGANLTPSIEIPLLKNDLNVRIGYAYDIPIYRENLFHDSRHRFTVSIVFPVYRSYPNMLPHRFIRPKKASIPQEEFEW